MRAALAAILVALLAFPAAAGAAATGTGPTFCNGETIQDHLAPLQRMPKLHQIPSSGKLGFGPGVRIGESDSLVVGKSQVGYSFFLERYDQTAHPNWEVMATLWQVDWRGRPVRRIGRLHRQLNTISSKQTPKLLFSLSGKPAVYRSTLEIRSSSGRKLGSYGSYYRVVMPTIDANLKLDAAAYHPGDVVLGRIENGGTETAAYGVPYSIERLEGETWIEAPESPKGPWILPLYFALPGFSGPCTGFQIPVSMPTGIYRMKKEVEFTFASLENGERLIAKPAKRFLTAEFEVAS